MLDGKRFDCWWEADLYLFTKKTVTLSSVSSSDVAWPKLNKAQQRKREQIQSENFISSMSTDTTSLRSEAVTYIFVWKGFGFGLCVSAERPSPYIQVRRVGNDWAQWAFSLGLCSIQTSRIRSDLQKGIKWLLMKREQYHASNCIKQGCI